MGIIYFLMVLTCKLIINPSFSQHMQGTLLDNNFNDYSISLNRKKVESVGISFTIKQPGQVLPQTQLAQILQSKYKSLESSHD